MSVILRLKTIYILIITISLNSFSLVAQPSADSKKGDINGIKVWQLPNAPDGTRPTQCWLAIGSSANGDIYISGHDHTNNSMLYRLNNNNSRINWVGDAATASKEVDNWEIGEVAEKFHTRPIEHNGSMYVATLNYSTLDNGFLSTRGFHWYDYNINNNTFTDLSANEVNGVGAEYLQVVTLQIDSKNNVIYGATIPESKIVKYDIASGQTDVLGTPWGDKWDKYIYTNRVMWVDSRGRLYITAGNERDNTNHYNGEPKEMFNHVWYYDPITGFGELPKFKLQGANAIEVGQWNLDHTIFYMSDDKGHLYSFEDEGAKFTYLGKVNYDFGYVWAFNVSADEETIYIGQSKWKNQYIHEYKISTGTTTLLSEVKSMKSSMGLQRFLTGYDSWDNSGSFFISNFSQPYQSNVYMLKVDPVKVKVAKGLLPELVTINLEAVDDDFVISRDAGIDKDLEIIYKVEGKLNGVTSYSSYHKSIITKENTSKIIKLEDISIPDNTNINEVSFSVIPDGNDYIVEDNMDNASLPLSNDSFALWNEVSIYPNPVKDVLTIKSSYSEYSVSVYSLTGNLVYSNSNNKLDCSINLNGFPSGIYFLEIETPYKKGIRKIIKK